MRITPNKICLGLAEEEKEVGSISISGVDSDGNAIVEKEVIIDLISELPNNTKINISGLLKVYFGLSGYGIQDVDIILEENDKGLYGTGTIYETRDLDGQTSHFTVDVIVNKKQMKLIFGKGNIKDSQLSKAVNYLNISVYFYNSNIILLDGNVHISQLGGDN